MKKETLIATSNVCGRIGAACIKVGLVALVFGLIPTFIVDMKDRNEERSRINAINAANNNRN